MLNLEQEELQNILFQFEQALYHHQQWYNTIIRSLICKLVPDQHDIMKNSHKECRFGQWLYSSVPKSLKAHPGFIALCNEHEAMHLACLNLLLKSSNNENIHPYDYDKFANALEKMHLELEALQREIYVLIYDHDNLTGATNRVSMLSVLHEQQNIVKRKQLNCSIAMIDLDNFKQINDKYGHISGDATLASISHYILENIRIYDKLFRYGGEEFLLCLPNTDIDDAFKITNRLRKKISQLPIKLGRSKPIYITVSIGISMLDPNLSVEESIEQADAALYMAKSEGKDCVKKWEDNNSV